MEVEGLIRRETRKTYEKSLICPMYPCTIRVLPKSQHRRGPDLRGVVHDVSEVDQPVACAHDVGR